MRARMAIFYFLFQACMNAIHLVFSLFWTSVDLLTFLPAFALFGFCLFLIKKSVSPEKVVAGFLTLSLMTVIVAVKNSHIIDINILSSFVFFLTITGLIISKLNIRLMLLTVAIAGTLVSYYLLAGKSADQSLILPPRQASGIMFIAAMANIFATYLIIGMVLRIKSIAQDAKDQELEWQHRRVRLEDLSSMTQTMRLLIDRPFHAFQRYLLKLEKKHELTTLQKMQGELDDLLLISKSFGWIYRAYREEGSSAILSTALLQQLQVLLSSKIREEGWTLASRHDGQPVEVFGPIPSIMLFLFTVVNQILEGPQPKEMKQMSMEIDSMGNVITCKLSWPFGFRSDERSMFRLVKEKKPQDSLRQELIRELSQICNADIQYRRDKSFEQLLISGSWRREAVGDLR